jgi:ABC-type transport system substrate-binding protein
MPDDADPQASDVLAEERPAVHEEVTRAAVTVLMPVFNNLVLLDQHKERNTIDTIVPDLAESWTWTEAARS